MAKIHSKSFVDLENAYQVIIDHLSGQTDSVVQKENFQGSAKRAAKALLEVAYDEEEIIGAVNDVLKKTFPVAREEVNGGMIVQGPIHFNCMCPHHLYPFSGKAFVGYIPSKDGNVLGLSKLTRITRMLAKRPILQEQLACDIASVLHRDSADKAFPFDTLLSAGSAVSIVAVHGCMQCRGVESNARTVTTELRGSFWEPGMEAKFYQAISLINSTQIV